MKNQINRLHHLYHIIKKSALRPANKRVDSKFKAPRVWSNAELKKFAHLFDGRVVNVSGWRDNDKEGEKYKNYFYNSSDYRITNYDEDLLCGYQSREGEIVFNLESKVEAHLAGQFEVAFCHTVLEHIFLLDQAFSNLCAITNDVLIVVVPFIQQLHGINDNVGDYWRFTPLSLKKLYEKNGLHLQYCASNGESANTSIYLFAVGYRNKVWDEKIPFRFDTTINDTEPISSTNALGANIIKN